MYPNPQDVLPLPPRPDLEQYRRRAKTLRRACRSGSEHAIRESVAQWIDALIALYFTEQRPSDRDRDRVVNDVATFAVQQLTSSDCALGKAQFVIARTHGFESWPKFAVHVQGVLAESRVSSFERAADAIVSGKIDELRAVLDADSDLIHQRSTREHGATLLHYVAANGVENFRQKTPGNIVDIARVLLDRGADVNATCDVYGGGATTLNLTCTSAHPRGKGVQLALADVLLARGAQIGPSDVRSALMNGCPEAAAFLCERGARVTIADAAGIGRLDLLDRFVAKGIGGIPEKELGAAMIMTAWYNRLDAAERLMQAGVSPAIPGAQGETALHVAAFLGNDDYAAMMIERGAPVNVVDDRYGTPPIVWALYAWLEERRAAGGYARIVRLLANAGARVTHALLTRELRSADPALHALLAGRVG